jgi:hypothetical protein
MAISAGMDGTRFFFRTSVAGKPQVDRLGAYLPEAHRRGLRVIVYLNVHWYSMGFAAKHPDWVQIKEDGQPLSGVYKTGTSFCVNSAYREWVFQIVRDLCAYDIDGIFYDGPIFFANTCYCSACRDKYRARYGADLPPKSERRGPRLAVDAGGRPTRVRAAACGGLRSCGGDGRARGGLTLSLTLLRCKSGAC